MRAQGAAAAVVMSLHLAWMAHASAAVPRHPTDLLLLVSDNNGGVDNDYFKFTVESSRRCDAGRTVRLYTPRGTLYESAITEQVDNHGAIVEGLGKATIGYPNPPEGTYTGVVDKKIVRRGPHPRVCLATSDTFTYPYP